MQAHRLGGLLCAPTAVAFLLMTGARGDPIVGFGQIAINGSPASTGFVDVVITPFSSSGVGYLNVAVDWNGNGPDSGDWAGTARETVLC